eukprot:8350015-Pyramimonas_sp.AAC.2
MQGMEGRNRMYMDLAAQGYTPYHYSATASRTQDSPLAMMSVPERQAKLSLLVAHLANPCDGVTTRDRLAVIWLDPPDGLTTVVSNKNIANVSTRSKR